jgi:hypothetical protein
MVSSVANVGGVVVPPWEGLQETVISTKMENSTSIFIVVSPLERFASLRSSHVGVLILQARCRRWLGRICAWLFLRGIPHCSEVQLIL